MIALSTILSASTFSMRRFNFKKVASLLRVHAWSCVEALRRKRLLSRSSGAGLSCQCSSNSISPRSWICSRFMGSVRLRGASSSDGHESHRWRDAEIAPPQKVVGPVVAESEPAPERPSALVRQVAQLDDHVSQKVVAAEGVPVVDRHAHHLLRVRDVNFKSFVELRV